MVKWICAIWGAIALALCLGELYGIPSAIGDQVGLFSMLPALSHPQWRRLAKNQSAVEKLLQEVADTAHEKNMTFHTLWQQLSDAADEMNSHGVRAHQQQGAGSNGSLIEHDASDLELPATNSVTVILKWLIVGVAAIICVLGHCGCYGSIASAAWDDSEDAFNKLVGYITVSGADDAVGQPGGSIRGFLRREARGILILPALAMVAAPWTTCKEGSPSWAYALFFIFLVRAKVSDIKLALGLIEGGVRKYFAICLGTALSCAELLDIFTDALFPVQAYQCDSDPATAVTPHFAMTFQQSAVPAFAALVDFFRFWGLLALCYSASLGLQVALSQEFDGAVAAPIQYDVAGLGALASQADDFGDDRQDVLNFGLAKGFLLFAKVLLENCLQLWLQSSYFGLSYALTSESAKRQMLLSIGLGLTSALLKSLGQLTWAARVTRDGQAESWVPAIVIVSLVALFMAGWTAVKMYFSFGCESHLWNISSGCVEI